MLFFTLVLFLAMLTVGFGMMIHGAATAPVGFEDDLGFHAVPYRIAGATLVYIGPERRDSDGPPTASADFDRRRYAGPRRRRADTELNPLILRNGQAASA